MNSVQVAPSAEATWIHVSRTPAYSFEVSGDRFFSRVRQGFAWEQDLAALYTTLPQRTLTPLPVEPHAIAYEQNLWDAVVFLAIAGLVDFLDGRVLAAETTRQASQVAYANAGWWERPGIGPAGVDLVAHGPAAVHSPGKPSSALLMADDLRNWLNVTYEDLAGITGVGKTTFHHWKRTGAEPRPATTYRLRSVHALVRALIAKLGTAGASDWLRVGTPSPFNLLLQGKYGRVETMAHDVLFSQAGHPERNFSGFAPYDPETDFEVRSIAMPSENTESASPQRIRLPRL